jgi:hypothetical protein
MNELKGTLHYIYLLQSSIECYSQIHPFTSDVTVYRGLKSGGAKLVPLYYSMIGEVIVWSSFGSTSFELELVIDEFIIDDDSILFEILLRPGDAAVRICDHSRFTDEFEVLIAASSGFLVESVEWINVSKENGGYENQLRIPLVELIYWMSWSDFDIDEPPAKTLL